MAQAQKHHVAQMYDYHVWANGNVFARLNELPPELYTQEVQSVFPTLATVVTHLYATELLWLQVMRQLPYEEFIGMLTQCRDEAMGASLSKIETMFHELEREYRTFFEEYPDLDRPASGVHPKFGRLDTTLAEMVQHVVNHGTYHRGNITAMLRQLGVPGASSDYVDYLFLLAKAGGVPGKAS